VPVILNHGNAVYNLTVPTVASDNTIRVDYNVEANANGDVQLPVTTTTATSGNVEFAKLSPGKNTYRRKYPPTKEACERCGSTEGVELEDSRTAYVEPDYSLWIAVMYDDKPPDPNAPSPLCRECAREHHAYWDEQWAEYYATIY